MIRFRSLTPGATSGGAGPAVQLGEELAASQQLLFLILDAAR